MFQPKKNKKYIFITNWVHVKMCKLPNIFVPIRNIHSLCRYIDIYQMANDGKCR